MQKCNSGTGTFVTVGGVSYGSACPNGLTFLWPRTCNSANCLSYYLSQTLMLPGWARMEGVGTGESANGTNIGFASGQTGIAAKAYNLIAHFGLFGGDPWIIGQVLATNTADAIQAGSGTTVVDAELYGFGRHGVMTASDLTGVIASQQYDAVTVQDVMVKYMRGDAFHASGGDGGVGTRIKTQAIDNQGTAYVDTSLYGNTYINPLSTANGTAYNASAGTFIRPYSESDGSLGVFCNGSYRCATVVDPQGNLLAGGSAANILGVFSANHSGALYVPQGEVVFGQPYGAETSYVATWIGWDPDYNGVSPLAIANVAGSTPPFSGGNSWSTLRRTAYGNASGWWFWQGTTGAFSTSKTGILWGDNLTTSGRSGLTAPYSWFPNGIGLGVSGSNPLMYVQSGTAAPTTGNWLAGDLVINSAPSVGGTWGWRCTTAGTPGTWEAMLQGASSIVGPLVGPKLTLSGDTDNEPIQTIQQGTNGVNTPPAVVSYNLGHFTGTTQTLPLTPSAGNTVLVGYQINATSYATSVQLSDGTNCTQDYAGDSYLSTVHMAVLRCSNVNAGITGVTVTFPSSGKVQWAVAEVSNLQASPLDVAGTALYSNTTYTWTANPITTANAFDFLFVFGANTNTGYGPLCNAPYTTIGTVTDLTNGGVGICSLNTTSTGTYTASGTQGNVGVSSVVMGYKAQLAVPASTADLTEWQSLYGVTIAKVDYTGEGHFNGVASTASSCGSSTPLLKYDGTCTSASGVTNAVTFNNSGSGTVSGSTYNGSSTLTVSYNTVGADQAGAASTAQSNAEAYALPKSGGAMTGPLGTQAEVHFDADTTNTGVCATAATIKATNGNRQNLTLTNSDACAPAFTQPSSGTMSITVKIIGSAAGTGTIGTVASTYWSTGSGFTTTPPTISTTGGAVMFAGCYLDGSNAYCVLSQ
jgi:hypothetical protein